MITGRNNRMAHRLGGFWTMNRGLALLAVSIGVLLSACGRDDPGALLGSARDYQAKGDHQAAIIQLKNVLQKQPENGEARLMLGKSALIVGDAPTAEKEFRKALEYGQAPAVVVPLIATALMQSGSADKIIAEFAGKTLDDGPANAELQARVGEAYLHAGDAKQAATAFAAASAADPKNVRGQLGQSRLKAREGKLAEASSEVERIVSSNPDSLDALLLLGELKLALGDVPAVRAALLRAVEVSPASPGPRLHLISLLIADNQLDAAATQIAAARAARGPEVPLQYFEALIAYGRKDYAKARDIAQQVLKRAPGHVPASILLGTIDYHEKRFAQAESQLQSAISQAPENSTARALLARSYLASGKPARAVETLRPVMDAGRELDPGMLMLVGEAHFASGDMKQAAALFERASQSKTQQSLARTRLAQIALVSGDVEGGVKRLESVAADEGAPAQADMALLAGYLRQGQTDKALEVARAMVKKRPTDPTAHHAVGSVLLIKKDIPAARTSFTKAVELNPTFMPAVASLAQLDLQENKPADARARFESVLAKDPKNEVALLGIAEVMARSRASSAEIVPVLQRAIAANPESVNARLALINLHLRNRDARAALTAAQEASATSDKDSRILDALGRAQLAAGDTNQAVDTFNKLAAAEPKSTLPLVRLASVHIARKEPEKAAEALLRAQRIAPNDANVVRDLAVLYASMGKPDLALKEAKALQASLPKSAAGFVVEGDVHAASRQWPAAEKAYRDALKVQPGSEAAGIKLHSVLLASGKKGEAEAMAKKWVTDNPKDMAFRSYLGELALRARDLKGAAAHYEVVTAQQPDNAIALNNLAWALGQLGDARAMGYAERALKIAPESASVLDTFGALLVARGEAAKGSEYLARAVKLAPDRHEIRLNYAKALLKAGRAEDARKELAQLQAVGQDFPGKSEVAELLKQ